MFVKRSYKPQSISWGLGVDGLKMNNKFIKTCLNDVSRRFSTLSAHSPHRPVLTVQAKILSQVSQVRTSYTAM